MTVTHVTQWLPIFSHFPPPCNMNPLWESTIQTTSAKQTSAQSKIWKHVFDQKGCQHYQIFALCTSGHMLQSICSRVGFKLRTGNASQTECLPSIKKLKLTWAKA